MGEDYFLEAQYEDQHETIFDHDEYWINANEANDYLNEGNEEEEGWADE